MKFDKVEDDRVRLWSVVWQSSLVDVDPYRFHTRRCRSTDISFQVVPDVEYAGRIGLPVVQGDLVKSGGRLDCVVLG